MPSIENLRKQAKLILRWHRDGYHPVATLIRSHLPDFRGLTDRQVLAATFRLSDAQELVARRSGFADWPALSKGIDTMAASTPTSDATITILAAEPQIFVADMQRSLAFYTGPLGFQPVFVHGDPPFYAQVVRDGARLNLRLVTGPVFDDAFRTRNADALSAMLTLMEAKPLFLELQRAGVTFHQSLRSEPWGARTFIVADPDGNLIGFAGAA